MSDQNKTIHLNDSPILDQIQDHWQKIASLLLWKLAKREQVCITAEDIKALQAEFNPGMGVIFVHGQSDRMLFQLVTEADARRIVVHNAGLGGNA